MTTFSLLLNQKSPLIHSDIHKANILPGGKRVWIHEETVIENKRWPTLTQLLIKKEKEERKEEYTSKQGNSTVIKRKEILNRISFQREIV